MKRDLPNPSIRDFLIAEVLAFVRAARPLPGVHRIALIGSLTTAKPEPKDADVLVSVADDADLEPLARLGRRLQGRAQSRNKGGDIFLADLHGNYLGRTCHWKECAPGIRMSCDALHCGRRHYLHDDFVSVHLPREIIVAPPLELCPHRIVRVLLPNDVVQGLLAPLDAESHATNPAQNPISPQDREDGQDCDRAPGL